MKHNQIEQVIRDNKVINLFDIEKRKKGWKLEIRFDSKLPPHELLTRDIRLHSPQWGDDVVFPHPISRIKLHLPTGHFILLEGYQQYNFFIEVSDDLIGGKARIDRFFLCGEFRRIVHFYRIGSGLIEYDVKKLGEEYNGTATRGWRAGSPLSKPVIGIFM